MSGEFELVNQTDLGDDVTVITVREWTAGGGGRRWTLVSTSGGQDVIVTPSGAHVDAFDVDVDSLTGRVLSFLAATL